MRLDNHIARGRRAWCGLILAVIVSAAAGCSHFDKHKLLPWEKEEPQAPDKVVAMWSNTVLTNSDRPATRGFGGRLMFYRDSTEKPILVDGTLIVYGFDESHRKEGNPRPDRKFIFTPEQFEKHYSKSDLGHSYSVWLPWDEATGAPTKVSMIVRFMPRKGSLVLGEQSTHLLPGPGPEEATAVGGPDGKEQLVNPASAAGPEALPNPVRAVAYQTEAAGARPAANAPAQRVRTTTIDVPVQSRLYRGNSTTAGPRTGGALPAAAPQAAPQENSAPAAPGFSPTLSRTNHYGVQRTRTLGQPITAPRPGFGKIIPEEATVKPQS